MEFDNIPSTNKTKKSKGLIITAAILGVLAVGGVGFGVFELVQNNQKNDEISSLKKPSTLGTIVTAPEQIENNKTETVEQKEIEITNGYVLRDLRHKIGILHGVNNRLAEKEDTIRTSLAYNFIERVYTNTLNTAQKSSIVLRGELKKASTDLKFYANDYSSKIRSYISSSDTARWWGINYNPAELNYISHEMAEDFYKQTFGSSSTMEKTNISTQVCGQDYLYVSAVDGFIEAPAGCGGAGFPLVFAKIDDYKAIGNEAYVDLRTASAYVAGDDATVFNLYDGLYYNPGEDGGNRNTSDLPESGSYKNGKILGTINYDDDVFGKYGDSIKKYRFVFNMNPDGTFYFSRVENLQ